MKMSSKTVRTIALVLAGLLLFGSIFGAVMSLFM